MRMQHKKNHYLEIQPHVWTRGQFMARRQWFLSVKLLINHQGTLLKRSCLGANPRDCRSVGMMWGPGICMLSSFQVILGQVDGDHTWQSTVYSTCCISNAYRLHLPGQRTAEPGSTEHRLRSLTAWAPALWSRGTWEAITRGCYAAVGECVWTGTRDRAAPSLVSSPGIPFLQLFSDDPLHQLEHTSPTSYYFFIEFEDVDCILFWAEKNVRWIFFSTTLWNTQSVIR